MSSRRGRFAGYRSFDGSFFCDAGGRTIYRLLLTSRNEGWMKKLPAMLSSDSCFIAVGFAHLQRECGLIAQLRKLGYSVEAVALQ